MQLLAQSRNVAPEARWFSVNFLKKLRIFWWIAKCSKFLLHNARGLGLIFNLVFSNRYWRDCQKPQILAGYWRDSSFERCWERREHQPQTLHQGRHFLQRIPLPRLASGRHWPIFRRMCGIYWQGTQLFMRKSLCQLPPRKSKSSTKGLWILHSLFHKCISLWQGYSRASAIVAAYLMQKKNYTAAQALMLLRESRECKPNVGFLQQLGTLDNKLRSERHRRLDFWRYIYCSSRNTCHNTIQMNE